MSISYGPPQLRTVKNIRYWKRVENKLRNMKKYKIFLFSDHGVHINLFISSSWLRSMLLGFLRWPGSCFCPAWVSSWPPVLVPVEHGPSRFWCSFCVDSANIGSITVLGKDWKLKRVNLQYVAEMGRERISHIFDRCYSMSVFWSFYRGSFS